MRSRWKLMCVAMAALVQTPALASDSDPDSNPIASGALTQLGRWAWKGVTRANSLYTFYEIARFLGDEQAQRQLAGQLRHMESIGNPDAINCERVRSTLERLIPELDSSSLPLLRVARDDLQRRVQELNRIQSAPMPVAPPHQLGRAAPETNQQLMMCLRGTAALVNEMMERARRFTPPGQPPRLGY